MSVVVANAAGPYLWNVSDFQEHVLDTTTLEGFGIDARSRTVPHPFLKPAIADSVLEAGSPSLGQKSRDQSVVGEIKGDDQLGGH